MSKTKPKKASKATMDGATPDAVSSENGSAEGRNEKRIRVGEELARELDGLRETLGEIVEGYRFKVEGQLAEIAAVARGTSRTDGDSSLLRASVAQKMLDSIRKTELKPKKGRAKDFQRLETLVDELTALLPAPK